MFGRRASAETALLELLRGFQASSVEAISKSATNAARQDAHEKLCTERYETLRNDQAGHHAENKAAIAALSGRIWTLVLTVAGSAIVILLGAVGWTVAFYLEHHP